MGGLSFEEELAIKHVFSGGCRWRDLCPGASLPSKHDTRFDVDEPNLGLWSSLGCCLTDRPAADEQERVFQSPVDAAFAEDRGVLVDDESMVGAVEHVLSKIDAEELWSGVRRTEVKSLKTDSLPLTRSRLGSLRRSGSTSKGCFPQTLGPRRARKTGYEFTVVQVPCGPFAFRSEI